MMKKRLSKTIWYGSEVDTEGNPIIPELAEGADDLEGLHHGELYLHEADDNLSLWARTLTNQVKPIGGLGGGGSLWKLMETESGEKFLFTEFNVVTQMGITSFADNKILDLPGIYDGLPIDNQTLYWEETTQETTDEEGNIVTETVKILKSKAGEGAITLGGLINVGEWADSEPEEDRLMVQKKGSAYWTPLLLSDIRVSFENILVDEESTGNAFTSFELSEDKKTITFKKELTFVDKTYLEEHYLDKTKVEETYYTKTDSDNTFAKAEDLNALQTSFNDFLNGTDTDAIINKWKELETFLSGLAETDNLATILESKVDKTYLDENFITKDNAVSQFVAIGTAQTITGEKNFTGGLSVNGCELEYNASLGYWKLTGDLLVTGGITSFADDTEFEPSTIMDALVLDGETLELQETVDSDGNVIKQLTVIGGLGTVKDFFITGDGNAFTDTFIDEDGVMVFTRSKTFVEKSYLDNNFYTKEDINEELKKYVPVEGDCEIKGVKSFTGSLQVNGQPIVYDVEGGYWKLNGDLLVTGGITSFGDDTDFTPSTVMDALLLDQSTLKIDENGQLTVIGGTGGGTGGLGENEVKSIIESYGYLTSSDLPTFDRNDFSVSSSGMVSLLGARVEIVKSTDSMSETDVLYVIV